MAVEPRKPVVLCPQCGKPVEWDAANPHRPFCSERCRLVDLGKWAAEDYRVPDDSGAEPPESGT
jgi:hypothetical protein